MLFSHASLLLALSTAVAAAPFEKKWFGFGSGSWSGESSSASGLNGIDHLLGRNTPLGSCNTASAQLPSSATDTLGPVTEGLKLYHVAVGRGTQNYTCDTTNATAVPVAVGAVADLFNVTCMAADLPVLLNAIPNIAVAIPIPSTADPSSPAYQDLSGHHYFTGMTTPYFNLDTALQNYGQGAFKKLGSMPAPAGAMQGSVAWLKLASRDPDQCAFQEVYRVNTAGGNPPDTCAGQPANIEVQYSAEYWFFS